MYLAGMMYLIFQYVYFAFLVGKNPDPDWVEKNQSHSLFHITFYLQN